jgi:hypothetical protein
LKRFLLGSLLAALVALTSGCASSALRDPAMKPSASGFHLSAATPAKTVKVTVAEEAKAKLADNLKFDQNRLGDTVRRALEAQSLLKADLPEQAACVQIDVSDVRIRSAFTAVAFGIFAGTDHIEGTVKVLDTAGNVVDTVKVSASYGLGGFAGGIDETRMSWLYEKFAEETVKALKAS